MTTDGAEDDGPLSKSQVKYLLWLLERPGMASIHRAIKGELEPLANYLRSNKQISIDGRNALAELLEVLLKKKVGRPPELQRKIVTYKKVEGFKDEFTSSWQATDLYLDDLSKSSSSGDDLPEFKTVYGIWKEMHAIFGGADIGPPTSEILAVKMAENGVLESLINHLRSPLPLSREARDALAVLVSRLPRVKRGRPERWQNKMNVHIAVEEIRDELTVPGKKRASGSRAIDVYMRRQMEDCVNPDNPIHPNRPIPVDEVPKNRANSTNRPSRTLIFPRYKKAST